MRHLAVVLALCATACLRPPNKQTGYVANGAAVAVGGAFLAGSIARDCDGGNVGESIGCGINKEGGTALGVGLIALGTLGLIITAASEAPDKP